MRVVLRKYRGKLEGFLGSGADPALVTPPAVFRFRLSTLSTILGCLAILFAAVLCFAHPTTAPHVAHVAPSGLSMVAAVAGSVTRIRELKEERARTITAARSILDKAETEKRELSSEEKTAYDNHLAAEQRQSESLQREERQVELERSLAGDTIPPEQRGDDRFAQAKGAKKDARTVVLESPEYRAVYERWLLDGMDGVRSAPEPERRALEATGGPSGGFLQAPMQFAQELIKFMDNLTFVRQRATKLPVTVAKALGAVSLDNDPADADWTAEIATGSEDSTMSFGNRELAPHPSAKRIKISNKLMRVTAGTVETLVRERLGYKFGITEEKAFLTGSGQNQPLGVFIASNSGISTGRDVSTGNTSTAVTFDGLIEAKYSLKAPYLAKAAWGFSRALVKNISKLKDGEGQYIWKLSVREGEPDTVLGLPFFMSEYVPSTFTTGLYVGILGDWSYYWIADALTVEIQRLSELYAESNQTGFIGRMELDAQPVLEEAFARVKLG